MPRATLTYKLPEEQEEFNTAMRAGSVFCAIHDIKNDVFRPARKHGYPDVRIQKLLETLDDLVDKHMTPEQKEELGENYSATCLVGLLESAFYEILNSWEVNEG